MPSPCGVNVTGGVNAPLLVELMTPGPAEHMDELVSDFEHMLWFCHEAKINVDPDSENFLILVFFFSFISDQNYLFLAQC